MRASFEERFWAKVEIPANVMSDCWRWTAATTEKGYGVIGAGGRGSGVLRAHRVAWESMNGPIPPGMLVRHLVCDNPTCVNPAHLALGTAAENTEDMLRKGREASGLKNGAHTKPDSRPRGEANNGKLTEAQVREIRARYAAGAFQRALAAEYGISQSIVSGICNRVRWAHVA